MTIKILCTEDGLVGPGSNEYSDWTSGSDDEKKKKIEDVASDVVILRELPANHTSRRRGMSSPLLTEPSPSAR